MRISLLILCLFIQSTFSATTFTFTLDEPCKTSAGVFKTDGTLVRTLWSGVRYVASGSYSTNWDGKDDWTNAAPAGTYVIKVLQHNVQYVWDGAMGNTSAQLSGLYTHHAFDFIRDMTFSGTNGYYCSGYHENQNAWKRFGTNDAQTLTGSWVWEHASLDNRFWFYTASDRTNVYFASQSSYDPLGLDPNDPATVYGAKGFFVSSKIVDASLDQVTFSSGIIITNGPGDWFDSGVYAGTQPGLSGMAVQVNSNLLAVSVSPDNRIYFYNKSTGASNNVITVLAPGRLAFDTNGVLWAVSSNNVVCITNCNGATPFAKLTNSFSQAVAVSVSSTNSNIILVADAGTNQQIKAISNTGVALWTMGMAGGYFTNGPAVRTNKFWFQTDIGFISFSNDGTYWVGDYFNNRVMHFIYPSNYVEQIMYQPAYYALAVDQNNPSRVFSKWLEFNVDYSKPFTNSWTLTNNWNAKVDANHENRFITLSQVTTLTNGRTYAMVGNNAVDANYYKKELAELVNGSGIRFTGIFPLTNASQTRLTGIGPDGSARAAVKDSALIYKAVLTNFDISNNPLWNTETVIASGDLGTTNPLVRASDPRFTIDIASNNAVILFDNSANLGLHLGGITVGSTNWLWQASPPGLLNGDGHYEIGTQQNGAGIKTIGHNIVYGYKGEFFRGSSQAGQHLHYYDDGLFVGQFGESWFGQGPGFAIPSSTGNGVGPDMAFVNGELYAHETDEGGHGLQRWHLLNAGTIREMQASVAQGGTVTLTNQSYRFPNTIVATNGNGVAKIAWSPVASAASYKVNYSVNNGGPYTLFGTTTQTNYMAGGLTNGVTYFFRVTPVIAGLDATPSEQVQANPFDTTQFVLKAGQINILLNYPTNSIAELLINSNAPPLAQASYVSLKHIANRLNLADEVDAYNGTAFKGVIGKQGYFIADFYGTSSVASNYPSSVSVPFSSIASWNNQDFLNRHPSINGNLGSPFNAGYGNGFSPNVGGSVDINVNDMNYHVLTVVSPAKFTDPRLFSVTLTSTNGQSTSYSVNDPVTGGAYTWQFLFKGNCTLGMTNSGVGSGSLQALFFDGAPVVTNHAFFVSQSGAGTGDGSSIANSASLFNFNAASIGMVAGDTIYLDSIGSFTDTLLMPIGGEVGAPITLIGGRFIRDAWPYTPNTSGGGAINIAGESHVIVDGAWVEATNNGTLLANQVNTAGIYNYLSASDVEIRNCVVTNLFVRLPLPGVNATNEQPTVSPIFLKFTDANNNLVHHNAIKQGGNGITIDYAGNCTNVAVEYNNISDVSFGVFLNVNSGGNAIGFSISHNICTNFNTYDGIWNTNLDHNHNNFLIVNSSSGTAFNYGLFILGNYAGGMCGSNMTSLIKVTPDFPSFPNCKIVNNVLVNNDPNALFSNGMISVALNDPSSNATLVANNTIVNLGGPLVSSDAMKLVAGRHVVLNNVFFGVSMNISAGLTSDTDIQGSDYNALNQFNPSIGDSAFFGLHTNTFQTYYDWTNNNHSFEQHSFIIYSNTAAQAYPAYLNTNGFKPVANGELINSATNLTVWGITNDFDGILRPATGMWYIGAFQSTNGEAPPFSVPPSILMQPSNISTLTNTTATFTLTAGGDAPLYYGWFFTNGTPATNFNQSASWTTNSGTGQTNYFVCVVTNGSGSVTSSIVFWHNTNGPALIAPSISVQPTDSTTLTNITSTFTLTASGSPPLGYQWRYTNNVPVTNFTAGATWTTNSGTPLTNFFYCVVTNTVGSVTSSVVFWHNTNGLSDVPFVLGPGYHGKFR